VLKIVFTLDTRFDLGFDLQPLGSNQGLVVVIATLPAGTTTTRRTGLDLAFDFETFVDFCYSVHEFVPFVNKIMID
jgi:hypothetical protein